MGFISDVSSMVGKYSDTVATDRSIASIKGFTQGPNSITKMAKKAVMTYPVILSEGVIGDDENLLNAICKYLEVQYSIFTMISMGLNPIFDGTDPSTHLIKFYSGEAEDFIDGYKANASVSISNDLKVKISKESLTPYNSLEDDTTDDIKRPSVSSMKILEKFKASDPTVISVKLKMGGGEHAVDVEIPIAIKAIPNFITDEESSRIFSYFRENKPILTLVRFLSGEISLFKDILFQLEKAKKDKDLYARLGRHPWFRQLMKKKMFFDIGNFIKLVTSSSKNKIDVMPICTLVVTKDEIEEGFGNLWNKIKAKEGDTLINKLMLLCLCVVDTTTGTLEFTFNGFNSSTTIRKSDIIKEYTSNTEQGTKDIEKLLKTMVYKVQ